MNEPVNKPTCDVDAPVDTVEQLETRKKKKKIDKNEGKKAEEPTAKAPRKRPSNSCFLDYVVVSDTLSGLDAGDKRAKRDPDDDVTLTEIMKKKKVLEDKKKELDEQATAALAAKKSKFQKETPPAPSESEIDLGLLVRNMVTFWRRYMPLLVPKVQSFSFVYLVFLPFFLDFDYHVYLVACVKLGKGTRKVDISKITPPTSLRSRAFDLPPPHADLGEKRKQDDVQVEQVGEGGVSGAAGGDGRGGGVDTKSESSEATPRHTIYTKRVQGSGEGGASGTHQSPEYEHVQGGS
ncbi:hypothetical protein Hanom_Chr17g01560521 [Helianthus anomalus]